jgi:hypothetical protein
MSTLQHAYGVFNPKTGLMGAIYAFRAMALANCPSGCIVRYIVTGRRH